MLKPTVPQRFDLKTETRFKDYVAWRTRPRKFAHGDRRTNVEVELSVFLKGVNLAEDVYVRHFHLQHSVQ